jgi:hypothetical protein
VLDEAVGPRRFGNDRRQAGHGPVVVHRIQPRAGPGQYVHLLGENVEVELELNLPSAATGREPPAEQGRRMVVNVLPEGKIMAAGLDVFAKEPEVPEELLAMENVVLLPHVGSGSAFTREKMDQLMVDNILAWAEGKPPLTPVPETPWRAWKV